MAGERIKLGPTGKLCRNPVTGKLRRCCPGSPGVASPARSPTHSDRRRRVGRRQPSADERHHGRAERPAGDDVGGPVDAEVDATQAHGDGHETCQHEEIGSALRRPP